MGPHGVDRAVHSMEFTDCENGLGKCLLTYSFNCTFVCLYNNIPSDLLSEHSVFNL